MSLILKPVREQVIVITGASSGVGLVTAKMAASRGAAVMLAARNEAALRSAVVEIRAAGGRASHAVLDVSDRPRVYELATRTAREFGHIDTWINCAGVAVFGRLHEIPPEDLERVFDVNFWGAVHGSFAAVPFLREYGGAILNVGSLLTDTPLPLHGAATAAAAALDAFTETLRKELEAEGMPISVTLVKPGSIDTPLYGKARTYTGFEPKPLPPVYTPEVVARVLLECAEVPVPRATVGRPPSVRDPYAATRSRVPLLPQRRDNLHHTVPNDGGERGRRARDVHRFSLSTWRRMHPRAAVSAAAALVGVIVLLGAAGWRIERRNRAASARHPARAREPVPEPPYA